MKAEIRVPTTQYGYINFTFEKAESYSPEQWTADMIEAHNIITKQYQDSLKTPEITLNSGLKPVDLLRLLYKPLCGDGLIEDEVESLGTDKIYSQRDVLKIVQSLINKSKRENRE